MHTFLHQGPLLVIFPKGPETFFSEPIIEITTHNTITRWGLCKNDSSAQEPPRVSNVTTNALVTKAYLSKLYKKRKYDFSTLSHVSYLFIALLSRRTKITKVELSGAHGITAPCGRSRVRLCLRGYCRARGGRLVLLFILHVHIKITSSNSSCL